MENLNKVRRVSSSIGIPIPHPPSRLAGASGVVHAVPLAQLRGAGSRGDEHVAAGLPGRVSARGRGAGGGAGGAGERADPRLEPLPRLPLFQVHAKWHESQFIGQSIRIPLEDI